jgi:hypothetical protein
MRKSLVTLSALVLAWAGFGRAQAQSTGSEKTARASTAPRTPTEGIAVHGRWTIKVSNPDGKLVQEREFENALNANTGSFLLLSLLMGAESAGSLGVGLLTGSPPSVCNNPLGVKITYNGQFSNNTPTCTLEPANFDASAPAQCVDGDGCFPVLTVTGPSFLVQAITLAGQITAEASGTITGVTTMLFICVPSVSPAACLTAPNAASYPSSFEAVNAGSNSFLTLDAPWGLLLTSAVFGTGSCGGTGQPTCQIPVLAGQLVSVSVALSFQ